jgi:uncharacterized protein YndB with AHSA1/START domain
MTSMPNSINLHRVIPAKPRKVFRAFTEPDALSQWIPPYGFVCTVHEFEPTIGGTHRMSFRNFTTGGETFFGGKYLDVKEDDTLVYTTQFEGDALPGEMRTTVIFREVSLGTELLIVQEGIPDVVPPEACYLGWQESLAKLERLVVPEIQM